MNRGVKLFRIGLVSSLWFVFPMSRGFTAETNSEPDLGFQVTGMFENSVRLPSGEQALVTGDFTVTVSGCRWTICIRKSGGVVDYFEAGSENRREVFLLAVHTNLTHSALSDSNNTPGSDHLNVGFGEAIAGEIPHFAAAEEIGMLWLAYASSCYFDSRTNNQIAPVFWLGGREFYDQGLTLPGEWSCQTVEPRAPLRVVYLNDGLIRGVDTVSGLSKVIPHPRPYQDGFTNAVYEVISSVDVGHYRVPKEFHLITYKPQPGKTAPALLVNRTFRFSATNASLIKITNSFVPALPGVISVKDHRVHGERYFYDATTAWPELNDVISRGRPEPRIRAVTKGSADSNQGNRIRSIAFGVMAVSSLMVFLAVKRTIKKEKEST